MANGKSSLSDSDSLSAISNGGPVQHVRLEEELKRSSLDGRSTKPTVNGDTQLLRPRTGLERKPSSPMSPAFMVSAPGKAIVYGEHAAVHGKV
jgi:hypothetical protein